MQEPVVVIGVGEIGGVFARAFLRCGRPVFPVVRGTNVDDTARVLPHPDLVLVSVGERDLEEVLLGLPEVWRDRVVLVQNELLPTDWRPHRLSAPTVASIWFEKKPGQDIKVIVPTPVFGPRAGLIKAALGTMAVPVAIVDDETGLLFELVRKNLYILVTNICGLETGGTVAELRAVHPDLVQAVAADVLDVQAALTGARLDREGLIGAMLAAFDADPGHQCMGRQARSRLARALTHGDRHGLAVPALRRIHRQAGEDAGIT